MFNLEKSPSVSRALSSGAFTDNASPAYGQNHLFNVNPPPWSQISSAEYRPEGENKRLHMRGEEMKEFDRLLQSAMAMQGSTAPSTLGNNIYLVELDTFQYAPQYGDMNTHHPVNGFAAVPAQQQPWELLNSAQTSLLGEASDRADAEQYSHQPMVASHHENMMSLFSHESATLLQAVTSVTPDCGNAPGSGVGGSGHWDLPQQPLSSTTFAHAATGEESRMQVSSPSPEGGISNTSASCRQGVRSYLCDCGVEFKRKGGLDRHRQSLQHSKRIHIQGQTASSATGTGKGARGNIIKSRLECRIGFSSGAKGEGLGRMRSPSPMLCAILFCLLLMDSSAHEPSAPSVEYCIGVKKCVPNHTKGKQVTPTRRAASEGDAPACEAKITSGFGPAAPRISVSTVHESDSEIICGACGPVTEESKIPTSGGRPPSPTFSGWRTDGLFLGVPVSS
ncbi:hypothetical protein JOM56_010360 [Amanita muscaria]